MEIAAKNGNIKVLNTLLKRGARYERSKEDAGELIKRLCEVPASKSIKEDKKLDKENEIPYDQTIDKLKEKEKKLSKSPKSKRFWKKIKNNLEKSKGREYKKENKTIDISFDKSFDNKEEIKNVKGDLIEYHKSFDNVKKTPPKNKGNIQEEDDYENVEVDERKVHYFPFHN